MIKLIDYLSKDNIKLTPELRYYIIDALTIMFKQKFNADFYVPDDIDNFLPTLLFTQETYNELITLVKKLEKLKAFN